MKFLFHSVIQKDDEHTRYFNIYKVDDNRYLAECHHFNQARICEGDFEITRNGDSWEPSNSRYKKEAEFIGTEINNHFSLQETTATSV